MKLWYTELCHHDIVRLQSKKSFKLPSLIQRLYNCWEVFVNPFVFNSIVENFRKVLLARLVSAVLSLGHVSIAVMSGRLYNCVTQLSAAPRLNLIDVVQVVVQFWSPTPQNLVSYHYCRWLKLLHLVKFQAPVHAFDQLRQLAKRPQSSMYQLLHLPLKSEPWRAPLTHLKRQLTWLCTHEQI